MTDEKKANDLAAAGGNGDLDLARLRLGQDFADKVGVKKALLTVPVRKPDRQSFVRVHPDPSWRLDTAVLTLKEERETYLHRLAFQMLAGASLDPVLSRALIAETAESHWANAG